jgi:hypothetical protein
MKRVTKALSIITIVMLALALMPVGSAFAALNPLGPITTGVTVAPNPVPPNSPATVTATVDDAANSSTIVSAEFSLNKGVWTEMAAVDGAFDSQTEAVTATFTSAKSGANEVCVHATDALGNTGPNACFDFYVDFVFAGFLSPIKMNVSNKATAPQTIPVKWKLTDGKGKLISDKNLFKNLMIMSYQVDCTTLAPLSTAVAGNKPGKSGLKYSGSGKWQVNWKTEKSFRGTCRMMYIAFNSVQNSPEVLFAFKK